MKFKLDTSGTIITFLICISVIFTSLIFTIGWVNSPSLKIEMDDNTKEAIMSLNDTISSIEIPSLYIFNASDCMYNMDLDEYWCK